VRQLSRLAAVAALTVLAAACGSSNNSNSTGGPATTAPAGAATTTSAGGGGGGEAEIEIEGFQYTAPASVPPGATIKVVNKDSTAHTVTSAKDKSQFDSEVEGNGTSTFTAPSTPGTYDIACNFHPNMHGTLVVK
jgi:plastocyanin